MAVLVRLIVLCVALEDVDHRPEYPLEGRTAEVHAGAVRDALDRGGARPEGEGCGVRGEG